MMLKRAMCQGIFVRHRRPFKDMNRAIDDHGIKPVIERVYAFEDAGPAFDNLERWPFRKVVVRFKSELAASYQCRLAVACGDWRGFA